MALYRATARRRAEQQRQVRAKRHQLAWQVARQASRILKEQFSAQQVILFGSLLQPDRFYERSDVDLAVRGLDESRYYRALARLLDIEPEIAVDLIELEFASERMLDNILSEGVEI
jgi:predicted nucleotidyltransferase